MSAKPVIKLAQPGYDVKTAGDENLIYSSKWPLLEIYQQNTATFDVTQTSILARHDLQFPPVFWYFANTPESAWQNSGVVGTARRSEFFGPIGDGSLGIDASQLTYTANTVPGTSGNAQLYFYIFALDLTKQYTAPVIKVGAVSGGSDSNFVFKIAKPNKDIKSHDLSDFVLHSKARSPLIHSVNPSPGTVKQFIVNHALGYTPMFFGYLKSGGKYTLLPTGQGGSSNFLADEQNITFNDNGGKELTIVILKDPFMVEYSIRVNV